MTAVTDARHAASGHAAAPPLALLRMAAGTETLAVPIDRVREILEVGRMTGVPRTPPLLRGVMNLRGAVVPVIDLAVRLGLPATTIGRRSCIVVVETWSTDSHGERQRTLSGLLVDAVFEVFDTDNGQLEPVPALGTRTPPEFLEGIARARGEAIGLLALTRTLDTRELAQAIGSWTAH